MLEPMSPPVTSTSKWYLDLISSCILPEADQAGNVGAGATARRLHYKARSQVETLSSASYLKRTRHAMSEPMPPPATSTMKLAPCCARSAKASPPPAPLPWLLPGSQNRSQNRRPAASGPMPVPAAREGATRVHDASGASRRLQLGVCPARQYIRSRCVLWKSRGGCDCCSQQRSCDPLQACPQGTLCSRGVHLSRRQSYR